jgi:hypothetical protein
MDKMTDFDTAFDLAINDRDASVIDLELDDELLGRTYPAVVARHAGGAAILTLRPELGTLSVSVGLYAGDGTVVAEYHHVL